MKISRSIVAALLLAVSLSYCQANASPKDTASSAAVSGDITFGEVKVGGETFKTATITTHATPAQVWSSILEEPNFDGNLKKRKVLSHVDSHSLVEEEFEGVPIIGKTHMVLETEETPCVAMKYKLVESNHIKSLEATWNISSCPQTKLTIIELRCHVELKFLCPQMLLDKVIATRLRRRLNFVKQRAEMPEETIAANLAGQH